MPEHDPKDHQQAPKEEHADESQEDTSASRSETETTDATSQADGQEQSAQSDESTTQGAADDEDDDTADAASAKDEAAADDDEDALVPLAKLKKVRNEAKNLRDRLKTAETRITELEAGGADTTLKRRVDELTTALRTERLATLIAREAVKVGAIEPSAVAKLIDHADVTWDHDKPTNVAAVLKQAQADYPKLFTSVTGTGNVGNRSERGAGDEAMSPSSRLRSAYTHPSTP